MTLDELNALEVVENPHMAVWLEESDPHCYYDVEGVEWGLMRLNGELVRFLRSGGINRFIRNGAR